MTCKHLGSCGSCKIYDKSYQNQLEEKRERLLEILEVDSISLYPSQESEFRNRAEFRVLHIDSGVKRGMFDFEKKLIPIDECKIVSPFIESAAKTLLELTTKNFELRHKLYAIDLFSNSKGEVVATLIYHKHLGQKWIDEALKLQDSSSINIIGRARKQKVTLKVDSLYESFDALKPYSLILREGAFFQPNFSINKKMLEFAKSIEPKGDLLELYCGNGNFSFALSSLYAKVFATEISKASIKDALDTKKSAEIENIEFGRVSADELIEALSGVRMFKRLEGVDFSYYDFKTLLVDPPRSGLGQSVVEFSKGFEQIIYISCNPKTLKRDIDMLDGFEIKRVALFDQFPWTPHIESGVLLTKKA